MLVKDVNFEKLYKLTKSIHSFREKKARVKTGSSIENRAEKDKWDVRTQEAEDALLGDLHTFFCDAKLIYDIRKQFATVSLVRGKSGLIDSYKTALALRETEFNLFNCMLFISNLRTRSNLYNSYDNGLNVKFGSLTPIFMAAHKKYNNVMYNEWDRSEDTHPALAIGMLFWHHLKDYIKPIPELDDNLLDLRTLAFEQSKSDSFTSYFLKAMVYEKDGKKIRAPTFISHIKGQFWIANARKRNKYMILDTVDWDNIPKSFDDIEYEGYTEKVIKKEKEDDMVLPW